METEDTFLTRLVAHARLRWPAVAAATCLAVASRLTLPAPPPRDVAGVAQILGRAIDGRVEPDAFVWEPSAGALADATIGRSVLFLGSRDGPRDLYRARVRMGREGRAVSVGALRNLSDTPLGDETDLAARGRYAAFFTRAFGVVQGATVLDLEGAQPVRAWWGRRMVSALDRWLEVGSARGLGRAELVFADPPKEARLELRDERLVLAVGEPARPAALQLAGLDRGEVVLETGGAELGGARAWAVPPRIDPPAHVAIDALRALLGTAPADAIEAGVFGARSALLRVGQSVRARPDPADAVLPVEPASDGGWPPAPLSPLFRHPLEGEGQWRAAAAWLPRPVGAVGDAEPYLLATVIRPDPDQPFSEVRLVAIDTRVLELHIEAGFDEPRPATGPRGAGRIPAGELGRTVAAFNGGFQTRHGGWGMMVDRRVLLPPKPGAATVAVDDRGYVRMGGWGASEAIPPELSALRQNLDPLIAGGVVNPRGRTQWGFAIDYEGAATGGYLTERSALCLTARGHLVYGWGVEVGVGTLARALSLAGCREAVHLDMNPGHVGFALMAAEGTALRAELLAREMSIAPRRFAEASPKDFFYLTLRDPRPRAAVALEWRPDGGEHPPPSWWPAVHVVELERLGVALRVRAFAPDRFEWQIRPGRREIAGRTALGALEPAAHARALVAIGLGVANRKENRRGLVLDGVMTLPIRKDLGVLAADGAGLELLLAQGGLAPRADASELVLLAEQGEIRPEARRLGAWRERSAACALEDGTVLVASGQSDGPHAHASALIELGCRRVVELNRGRQLEAFVHRAGSEPGPRAEYEDTTLYGMSHAAEGTARPLP